MSFTFVVPDDNADASRIWRQKHKKICKIKCDEYNWTWSFKPTEDGCILILKCDCGEELDLSS